VAKSEESRAVTANAQVKIASIHAVGHWGCTLGDLRKLVAAADGIPDSAEVLIEDLQKHYARVDTFLAETISVRSEQDEAGSDR
jgi:hypothetical protein